MKIQWVRGEGRGSYAFRNYAFPNVAVGGNVIRLKGSFRWDVFASCGSRSRAGACGTERTLAAAKAAAERAAPHVLAGARRAGR